MRFHRAPTTAERMLNAGNPKKDKKEIYRKILTQYMACEIIGTDAGMRFLFECLNVAAEIPIYSLILNLRRIP